MSELLSINVNDHVEKKNGLTYLSWAWAWAEVLKIDPQATWEHLEFNAPDQQSDMLLHMEDGTCMVGVQVRIKDITRRCLLPVMDHRNKAIPTPNAFDVNKAQMRCLAKAIAMHGLGLYIYAGEDLPEGDSGADTRTPEIAPKSLHTPAAKASAELIIGTLSNQQIDDLQGIAKTLAQKAAKSPEAVAIELLNMEGDETMSRNDVITVVGHYIKTMVTPETEKALRASLTQQTKQRAAV